MEVALGILLAVLTITSIASVALYGNVVNLNTEVDLLEESKKDWKDHALEWEWKYLNKDINTEYITETRWINNTVVETKVKWNNETIYINDAIFDVNRDGIVDAYDSFEVMWYIENGRSIIEDYVFEQYGNPYEKLYDVNRDGNVNYDDANLISQHCE